MEKDKFQPIVMPCTKEQYESLIPVLEKNNIKYDHYRSTFKGIVNNFNNNINSIGKVTEVDNINFHKIIMNRKIYKRFDRKIFLKSLGIVEEPEFVLPEKWCIRITKENLEFCRNLKHNELHFPYQYSYTIGGFYGPEPGNTGAWGTDGHCGRTEITFEQFQKYVLKQDQSILESQLVTNKQTNTMVKITVEESQPKEKIHRGCLVKWKDIIAIVTLTKGNYIEIMSLSKGVGTIYNINIDIEKVSLFKGKLTLEQ